MIYTKLLLTHIAIYITLSSDGVEMTSGRTPVSYGINYGHVSSGDVSDEQ